MIGICLHFDMSFLVGLCQTSQIKLFKIAKPSKGTGIFLWTLLVAFFLLLSGRSTAVAQALVPVLQRMVQQVSAVDQVSAWLCTSFQF